MYPVSRMHWPMHSICRDSRRRPSFTLPLCLGYRCGAACLVWQRRGSQPLNLKALNFGYLLIRLKPVRWIFILDQTVGTEEPYAMYAWRRMTPELRAEILALRQAQRRPWHSPPHRNSSRTDHYLFTAACYEHRTIIGNSLDRMAAFEDDLLEIVDEQCKQVFAWVVLPNQVLCGAPHKLRLSTTVR